jgi:hypothetical protein
MLEEIVLLPRVLIGISIFEVVAAVRSLSHVSHLHQNAKRQGRIKMADSERARHLCRQNVPESPITQELLDFAKNRSRLRLRLRPARHIVKDLVGTIAPY